MKYLLITLLVLIGCSSSNQDLEKLNLSLKEALEKREDALRKCQIHETQLQSELASKQDIVQVVDSASQEGLETEYPYSFTSSTVKLSVKCKESKEATCCVTFKDCEDGSSYYCQVGVQLHK